MSERVTGPLDDLNRKIDRYTDRRASLAQQARKLRRKLQQVLDETAEIDESIKATRGLLNVAEAVRKQAEERLQKQQQSPVNKAPAKRAATKRAASKSNQPTSEENPS